MFLSGCKRHTYLYSSLNSLEQFRLIPKSNIKSENNHQEVFNNDIFSVFISIQIKLATKMKNNGGIKHLDRHKQTIIINVDL